MDGTSLLWSLLSAMACSFLAQLCPTLCGSWLLSALPCCLLSGLLFGAVEVCNPLSNVAVVDLLFSKMTLVLGKNGARGLLSSLVLKGCSEAPAPLGIAGFMMPSHKFVGLIMVYVKCKIGTTVAVGPGRRLTYNT